LLILQDLGLENQTFAIWTPAEFAMSDFGQEHGHENAFGHDKKDEIGVDLSGERFEFGSAAHSKGSDLQSTELEQALSDVVKPADGVQPNSSGSDNAAEPDANHFSPEDLANPRGLDDNLVERFNGDLNQLRGPTGDSLDGRGGTNTIIAGGDADVIFSNTPEAQNTVTTGFGRDLIVLGKEATADIFDFNPTEDRFGLDGLSLEQIVFGQGQNPDKGGLEQPLDSENNAVVLDSETGHTLAALRFTNAEDLSEKNFVLLEGEAATAAVV
jgi:hypothetical protein